MSITYTGNSDLRLASILSREIHEQAYDKTDLRSTVMQVPADLSDGSLAVEVTQVDWSDAMAAVNTNETSAPSDTDLTTGTATITVARQAIVRTLTGQFRITGGPSLQSVAGQIAGAASQRFTDMVTALFSSVTASEGTAGQKLTLDDVYDASGTLRATGAEGPFTLVLSHTQFDNFLESLRAEGQALHTPESADMLRLKEAGFQGVWNNISVYACDSVAGEVGCLYDMKAFGYVESIPPLDNPAFVGGPVEGAVWAEYIREADLGQDQIVGNYFVGVGIVENGRAVKIVSGA